MTENLRQIEQEMSAMYDQAVRWRRTLHSHPQPGWLEFYSTAFIAEKLHAWGLELRQGAEIIDADRRLFLPDALTLQREYDAAIEYGANPEFLEPARGGLTGVVAELQGTVDGPTVAFRFDIDSLEIFEVDSADRRAAVEGYVSCHPGYAHMCGHDVHTVIGLLVAKYYAEHRDLIRGTLRFIFQPDEERLSGARSMIPRGVVSGVDYLIAGHVASNMPEIGHLAPNSVNILAVRRWKFRLKGKPAHSTGQPQQGKNALLGACTAAANIHAIAPHGGGTARVNVGKIASGNTWNVIPPDAELWVEIRGADDEIFSYLDERVNRIFVSAAQMYDLELEKELVVESLPGVNSPELIELAAQTGKELSCITSIHEQNSVNASEDFTLFSKEVREAGGMALYMIHGTPVEGGLHSDAMDVDERVMTNAASVYAAMYLRLRQWPSLVSRS